MIVVITAIGVVALCVLGFTLVSTGIRSGDQAGDAIVTAWLGSVSQPDGDRPVVIGQGAWRLRVFRIPVAGRRVPDLPVPSYSFAGGQPS